jgi:uncharacterized protein (TIGR03435 family)
MIVRVIAVASFIAFAQGLSPMGISVSNIPVRNLIEFVYHVRCFQVLGGPTWIDSEKMAAKPKSTNVSSERIMGEMPAMLQKLMADRFKLKLRRQPTNFPYSL